MFWQGSRAVKPRTWSRDMIQQTEGRELLSVKEVASRLSVGPRTVWRWAAQGKLPRPLRLSKGCVRWWSTDVDRFLEALRRE
jgi:prophage regulatory protein